MTCAINPSFGLILLVFESYGLPRFGKSTKLVGKKTTAINFTKSHLLPKIKHQIGSLMMRN